MKKIDFLFVYEHPERELECILILKCRLQRMGYTVELFQMPIEPMTLPKRFFGNVRTVVVPFMYSNKELYDVVYRIAGQAEYVVNLQWEQVLTNKQDQNKDSFWFPKETAVNAKHLCWGKHEQDNLLRCGVSKDNAPVTGCISLDFLNKNFDEYFISKQDLFSSYNISDNGRVVLFISSFSNVVVDDDTVAKMNGILGEEAYTAFRNNSIQSQKDIVQWLVNLANEGYSVIYRTHPNETLSSVVKEASSNTNFKVIGDLSAKQWIKYADYVFTWISTTYAECYYLKVPCGVLRPVHFDEERDMCIFNGMSFVTNYDELKELMNTGFAVDVRSTVENFYDMDSVPAYERILGILHEMINDDKHKFCWDKELLSDFRYRKKQEDKVVAKFTRQQKMYNLFCKLGLSKSRNSLITKLRKRHFEIVNAIEAERISKQNLLNDRIRDIENTIDRIV